MFQHHKIKIEIDVMKNIHRNRFIRNRENITINEANTKIKLDNKVCRERVWWHFVWVLTHFPRNEPVFWDLKMIYGFLLSFTLIFHQLQATSFYLSLSIQSRKRLLEVWKKKTERQLWLVKKYKLCSDSSPTSESKSFSDIYKFN